METGTPIRILMVVPRFPPPVTGGVGRQALLLTRELIRSGHQVTAVGRRFRDGQKGHEIIDGVELVRLCCRFRLLDEIYPVFLPFLLFPRRRQFDIVHIHSIRRYGFIALAMAKAMGMKTMFKIPAIGPSGIPELGNTFFDGIRKWLLRRSDCVVALTEETVDELIRLGYPTQRILRVVNGVDTEMKFTSSAPRKAETVNVVYAGRITAIKGLEDLLTAWEILHSCAVNLKIHLRIHGTGPLESRIRQIISARSLGNTVTMCGHSENVQEIFCDADIFVLPSYMEGVSNAVLEAMAAGLPIVGTTLGGTVNLVGRHGTRFLYAPGDTGTLSEILLSLVKDQNLREEAGRQMRLRVETHFSMKRIKEVYLQGYNLIIEGKANEIAGCSDFPVN
jgi:glycosyltransferase involved in cell wall biosynthesis